MGTVYSLRSETATVVVSARLAVVVLTDGKDTASKGSLDQAIAVAKDRGVLVFPQIQLTNAEQLAFTDKFGTRVKFTGTVPGGEGGSAEDDELYKITLDKEFNSEPEYVLGTWFWHIDGVTIDQPLPKAPWHEPGSRWSARRVLLHVIAETAQHAGHADIIRESLDGAKSMG